MTLPRDAIALRLSPRLLVPAGLLVAALIALRLFDVQDPMLRRLRIEAALKHIKPEEVRAVAEPFLGAGFFGSDIEAVKNAVAVLPWVARVRVERNWPGALTVRLWEREPYARWNETALIDVGAVTFTPEAAALSQTLPQLGGAPGHEREVMEAYRRLSGALASTPFALTGLKLDPRGEWYARTWGDIELRLGPGRPDDKLNTIAGAVTQTLAGRLDEVLYVDLRYTNGFAVGWREPAAAQGGKTNG